MRWGLLAAGVALGLLGLVALLGSASTAASLLLILVVLVAPAVLYLKAFGKLEEPKRSDC